MLWKEGILMKKNLGVVQAVYPMPVLIVAAYDENGKSERHECRRGG